MSRDMLSQDEIDALLRQSQIDQGNEVLDINQYFSPIEQDALGEIGNISFGSASTALSTLLGQKVEITTPNVSVVHKDNLTNEFPSPHVAIHVEYTEGFQGLNLLVIKSIDAKIIADLMLGGSGKELLNEELTEMDISAVQEAMNQMMGSAATSMSTVFNMTVDISPPGVDILDLEQGQGENSIPKEDVLVKVSFRLKIGELIDSNIMQLTTVNFAKNMIGMLMGTYQPEKVENKPNTRKESNDHSVKTPDPMVTEVPPINFSQQTHGSVAPKTYNHLGSSANYHQQAANVNVQPAQFSDFQFQQLSSHQEPNLNLLMDIPLQITVELGRTKKLIKDILELAQGSIIELDKLAGEPVDIFANNKLIAKGEVVVIDENFGVRVTDIISQYDRIQKLQ
ncbi:flagellar motor switch phosphatase FliY [Tepidibacillus sp. HK-1]|uniref:flagellar motor switch phosphatase FliY n=1 Tax=Tepidibacillus sp. HK-1 TaxID=1883407 RepID=UPI000852D39F|nr:flagellar motor switch phosphatase FliY [Tepidibacillus sp. HK-1]GBF11611.1 flagellar motor switch protein FliN [Tepidibacillus sp. HK-1]